MLEQSNNRMYYYSPEEVAALIIQKKNDFQLIDVRPESEFEKFSLPGALNIPITEILSEEYRDFLNQDIKNNIFYSNGTVDALKAWMIVSQLGWPNNYIMEGGLNYWAEVIMNPLPPAQTTANEEVAKYQFRKAAGKALSGNAEVETTDPAVGIPKPPVQKRTQRKKVEGGC
jgi:rhodanese-related sulfurtransferase